MDSVNPATVERLDTYEEHAEHDVEDSLERATTDFRDRRYRPTRERDRPTWERDRSTRERDDHYAEHASVRTQAAHHPGPPETVLPRDSASPLAVVDRIHADRVSVDRLLTSDPRVPVGAVGNARYGRELPRGGIGGFVNWKTVRVAR